MTLTISAEDFFFFETYLKNNSGYHLTEAKRYLLEARLKPVIDLHELSGVDKIVNALRMNPRCDLGNDVIEAMTVNETFFFRDETPFKVFSSNVLPLMKEWCEDRVVKIMCGACSSGQEPYSLAMLLTRAKNTNPNLKYEILASDINNKILAKARKGLYSNLEVNRGLSSQNRDKYFEKISANSWQLKPEISKQVTFFQQNLKDDFQAYRGLFDVFFLRNVLIYFDQDLKLEILGKVSKVMRPGGFLFLGTSENIYNSDLDFDKVTDQTGVYRKKGG